MACCTRLDRNAQVGPGGHKNDLLIRSSVKREVMRAALQKRQPNSSSLGARTEKAASAHPSLCQAQFEISSALHARCLGQTDISDCRLSNEQQHARTFTRHGDENWVLIYFVLHPGKPGPLLEEAFLLSICQFSVLRYVNSRPHLTFRYPRMHLEPFAAYSFPYCHRALQQRRMESLSCSESSHNRFDYVRSQFDPYREGQTKNTAFCNSIFWKWLLNQGR